MKRSAGILLAVFSLPGRYGIGNLGKSAYDFVDFLYDAGQSYWQVLPVGPTSYGDSPYQSPSTFAGNPYFIDPDMLCDEGLLTKEECIEEFLAYKEEGIDYETLYERRLPLLKTAYARFTDTAALDKFIKKYDWVRGYALFQSLKDYFKGKPWTGWPQDIKKRDKNAIRKYRALLKDEIRFYSFVQLKFFEEWKRLKEYANQKGISIIGDIPIYVAPDSADVWENQSLFKLYIDGTPKKVAGVPPDYFSRTGQLWGNPIYDWDRMKEEGFSWWIKRIKACFGLYDCLRIDHFRGLESYYQVWGHAKTAQKGKWIKGPGCDFIDTIKKSVKDADIIAEDLGLMTPEVEELLKYSGFPGMKVLLFGFDSDSDNQYLPHNCPENCIVYTGTHDNNTSLGWFKSADKSALDYAGEYLGIPKELIQKVREDHDAPDLESSFELSDSREAAKYCVRALIRAGFMTRAFRVIIPMADWLNLDDSARVNTPSTLGGNWTFRISKGALSEGLSGEIRKMTEVFGRI